RAVDELMAAGPGDVLVFCSGEREIRDAADALAEHLGPRYLRPREAKASAHSASAVEVLPLYARLSSAEQQRVFRPHTTRRVVLASCPGEGEARDAAAARPAHLGPRYLRPREANASAHSASAVEVLPLYARLSSAEQQRVFRPHTTRRVVLATNVAETSLTVPGIRYVVDPGTARISRYSNRTKVQRLPIEPISQASANQRAGRSGRVAPGIAIRLYEEEDYDSRPEFTEPEILRTSLASVILQ